MFLSFKGGAVAASGLQIQVGGVEILPVYFMLLKPEIRAGLIDH